CDGEEVVTAGEDGQTWIATFASRGEAEEFVKDRKAKPGTTIVGERRALAPQRLYWLIERGSPAEYLERESYGADYWTSNAGKALKFPTEAAAKDFVATTILRVFEEIRVCEHAFII